ncbi:putative membrane protein YccC [Actinocorallia herbida]|uniref:Putative membrane protein YccC n=1 Tax=Actinocorallia herbida TaxID=58109 RepID=A0A3N1CW52_9ACTN|nr:FUSC family protein [Actinocorallia herbida]ROO85529.1 putative membrane protein YccC [Actinocorallia herbida]
MATGGSRTDTRGWLSRAVAWSDAPPAWSEAVCAAIGLGVAAAVSTGTGDPVAGLFLASGMVLAAVRADTGSRRARLLGILAAQLAGALGLVIGQLTHGHGWGTVAVTTLVALVCGLISPIGKIVSTAAMSLLFLDVTGTGLPSSESWWTPPLLQLTGGCLYSLLVVLSWRVPGAEADPGRRSVAAVYAGIADLVASPVRPGGAEAAVSEAVDAAEDTLLRYQIPVAGRRDSETRWLIALLNAASPLMEAVTVLVRSRSPAPPGLAEAVRLLADAVRSGHRDAAIPPFEGDPTFARPVGDALRVLRGDFWDGPDAVGMPRPLPERAGEAVRTALYSASSWRYGFRLALCIGIASAIVEFQGAPHSLWISATHSFWIPLTVAIVLKPDLGSVFVRALLRALGTVVAAVPTLLLLVVVPRGWAAVPLAAFFGGLIPLLKGRSYAMRAVTVTPVMLYLLDTVSSLPPEELVLARLADTLLGCLIVLVFGYALWPRSWRVRPRERAADALQEIAAYLEEAFTAPDAARSRDRRRIHRSLNVFRARIDRMLAEPPPASRAGAGWRPVVLALGRLVDAVTAAAVRVESGHTPPSPAEVRTIAAELRESAADVRAGRPPRAGEGPPAQGVLRDVVAEIGVVRSILPR